MAANNTDPAAQPAHGADPQLLLEKPTRESIYACIYWQTLCFGQNAAGIVHLSCALRYVGGTFGTSALIPTPFLCLLNKLLQLGPEPELVDCYLTQSDFKYPRVLAAMYVRLVAKSAAVYAKLEPLLNDFRKLVYRADDTYFELTTVDQFVEQLLTQAVVCGVQLPRLQSRKVLVEIGALKKRVPLLSKEDLAALDAAESDDDDDT